MSIKNVEKFFDLIKSDENIAKEIIKINNKLQQKDTVFDEEQFIKTEVVPIAKKHGINFTAKEFLKYAANQISELSDEELLNISGGASRQSVAWGFLLATLGSFINVAAINSQPLVSPIVMEATQEENNNSQKKSSSKPQKNSADSKDETSNKRNKKQKSIRKATTNSTRLEKEKSKNILKEIGSANPFALQNRGAANLVEAQGSVEEAQVQQDKASNVPAEINAVQNIAVDQPRQENNAENTPDQIVQNLPEQQLNPGEQQLNPGEQQLNPGEQQLNPDEQQQIQPEEQLNPTEQPQIQDDQPQNQDDQQLNPAEQPQIQDDQPQNQDEQPQNQDEQPQVQQNQDEQQPNQDEQQLNQDGQQLNQDGQQLNQDGQQLNQPDQDGQIIDNYNNSSPRWKNILKFGGMAAIGLATAGYYAYTGKLPLFAKTGIALLSATLGASESQNKPGFNSSVKAIKQGSSSDLINIAHSPLSPTEIYNFNENFNKPTNTSSLMEYNKNLSSHSGFGLQPYQWNKDIYLPNGNSSTNSDVGDGYIQGQGTDCVNWRKPKSLDSFGSTDWTAKMRDSSKEDLNDTFVSSDEFNSINSAEPLQSEPSNFNTTVENETNGTIQNDGPRKESIDNSENLTLTQVENKNTNKKASTWKPLAIAGAIAGGVVSLAAGIYNWLRPAKQQADQPQAEEIENIQYTGCFTDFDRGYAVFLSASEAVDIDNTPEETKQNLKEKLIRSFLETKNEKTKDLQTIIISSNETPENELLAIKNAAKNSELITSNLSGRKSTYAKTLIINSEKNQKGKVTSATMNVYVDNYVCTMGWNAENPDDVTFSKPFLCPDISAQKFEAAKNLLLKYTRDFNARYNSDQLKLNLLVEILKTKKTSDTLPESVQRNLESFSSHANPDYNADQMAFTFGNGVRLDGENAQVFRDFVKEKCPFEFHDRERDKYEPFDEYNEVMDNAAILSVLFGGSPQNEALVNRIKQIKKLDELTGHRCKPWLRQEINNFLSRVSQAPAAQPGLNATDNPADSANPASNANPAGNANPVDDTNPTDLNSVTLNISTGTPLGLSGTALTGSLLGSNNSLNASNSSVVAPEEARKDLTEEVLGKDEWTIEYANEIYELKQQNLATISSSSAISLMGDDDEGNAVLEKNIKNLVEWFKTDDGENLEINGDNLEQEKADELIGYYNAWLQNHSANNSGRWGDSTTLSMGSSSGASTPTLANSNSNINLDQNALFGEKENQIDSNNEEKTQNEITNEEETQNEITNEEENNENKVFNTEEVFEWSKDTVANITQLLRNKNLATKNLEAATSFIKHFYENAELDNNTDDIAFNVNGVYLEEDDAELWQRFTAYRSYSEGYYSCPENPTDANLIKFLVLNDKVNETHGKTAAEKVTEKSPENAATLLTLAKEILANQTKSSTLPQWQLDFLDRFVNDPAFKNLNEATKTPDTQNVTESETKNDSTNAEETKNDGANDEQTKDEGNSGEDQNEINNDKELEEINDEELEALEQEKLEELENINNEEEAALEQALKEEELKKLEEINDEDNDLFKNLKSSKPKVAHTDDEILKNKRNNKNTKQLKRVNSVNNLSDYDNQTQHEHQPRSSKDENILAKGFCGNALENDGKNVKWVLYNDGRLEISGQGSMENLSKEFYPWHKRQDKIKTVNIAEGVTSIGESAFSQCENLEKISISAAITSWGKGVFRECRNLTTVEITGKTTSIGDEAFFDCEKLTNIVIPNGVTSIGYGAFYHCVNLPDISLPDSVSSIGDEAFYDCEKLTNIVIPKGVTSIGDGAFYHCVNLTTISLPDSVSSIGKNAFYYCIKLPEIKIPTNVTSIEEKTFFGCTSLATVEIPKAVLSIGEAAFYGSGLTSITLVEGLQTIGASAFASCSNLKELVIPASVTSIDTGAFENCENLEFIIYYGLTNPAEGNRLFVTSSTSKIKYPSLYVPENYKSEYFGEQPIKRQVKSINYKSWSPIKLGFISPVKNMNTPINKQKRTLAAGEPSNETVDTTQNNATPNGTVGTAQNNATPNETVGTPQNNATPNGTFGTPRAPKTGASPVTPLLNNNNNGATNNDDNPPAANLSENQTPISSNNEEEDQNLQINPDENQVFDTESDAVPDDSDMFSGNCGAGEHEETVKFNFEPGTGTLTISGNGPMKDFSDYLDNRPWFRFHKDITKIIIKDEVTTIGHYAFMFCKNVTTVTIPDSVTSIGTYAFYSCSSLTEITIPSKVESIGQFAFITCGSLKNVNFNGTNDPKHDMGVFMACPADLVITVPQNYNSDTFCDRSVTKTGAMAPTQEQ